MARVSQTRSLWTVTRIQTFYLYEFLLAITVITMILQMVSIMDSTNTRHTPKGYEVRGLQHGILPAFIDRGNDTRAGDAAGPINLIPDDARETLPSTFACRSGTQGAYSMLVFGGLNVVRQWQELQVLVKSFKSIDKGSYSFNVTCPYQRTTPQFIIEEGRKDVPCESQLTVVLSANVNELNGKDVVVLGMAPYSLKIKSKVMRTKVSPDQLFIFYGVETPLRMTEWIPYVGNQPVHGVWSYTSSSELVLPYGRYRAYQEPVNVNLEAIVGNKSKLVAWMGSNCVKQVFWPRMKFIHELQKFIRVDTYGKCGNLTCMPRMSKHCQTLMGEYKFYLALENAECGDYVTEKFWDTALIQGAVPVVYGARRVDYQRVAPPDSFIHVSDFESVESLANYLLLLDRNDALYQKYFQWRRIGEVRTVFPPLMPASFCDIMKQYHILKKGLLVTRELAKTSWYQGCRLKARSNTSEDLTNWLPWK